MDDKKFIQIVEERCEKIKKVLAHKAKEYARGDRLSNFKRAASFGKCTPEKALLGMLTKHLVATFDFVDDLENGKVMPLEQWEEKIGDSINYLILLEGLIKERINDLP